MPVFLTNKAIGDLKEIGRYTERHWGVEQRNLYLRMLDGTFRELAENPSGRDCSYVREGYRKFRVGSHVIFYLLISSDTVQIVRVLHRRMDHEAQLLLK